MSSQRHQLAEVSGDIAVQYNQLQLSKHPGVKRTNFVSLHQAPDHFELYFKRVLPNFFS